MAAPVEAGAGVGAAVMQRGGREGGSAAVVTAGVGVAPGQEHLGQAAGCRAPDQGQDLGQGVGRGVDHERGASRGVGLEREASRGVVLEREASREVVLEREASRGVGQEREARADHETLDLDQQAEDVQEASRDPDQPPGQDQALQQQDQAQTPRQDQITEWMVRWCFEHARPCPLYAVID